MGGYGCGKTQTIAAWAFHRSAVNPPHVPGLIVCPTLKMARRTVVRALIDIFEKAECQYTLNKTDGTVTWGPERRLIWIESGEIPTNLSGTTVGWAALDEFGLLDEEVERRVVSRVRHADAVLRQLLYVGTPEGGGWSYARVREAGQSAVFAKASDNVFMPRDAIARLENLYRGDPIRYAMYVEGKPLRIAGNIYTAFDPTRHVRQCSNPRDGTVVVGADFNVGLMCSPVARYVPGEVHILDEVITRNTNTQEHFGRVKEALLKSGLAQMGGTQFFRGLVANGAPVEVWCDASGAARKTSSTTTDRNLLVELGFQPRHRPSNPAIRDRIETVQHALAHDRLFVSPAARLCVRALQEQDYEPSSNPPQPRKGAIGSDEPLDAATDPIGYMVCGVLPVQRPGLGRTG